jgi:hypothetical protein
MSATRINTEVWTSLIKVCKTLRRRFDSQHGAIWGNERREPWEIRERRYCILYKLQSLLG